MAVIFDTDKAFLHIPKTGGMWVRDLLRVNGIDYDLYAPAEFPETIDAVLIQENAKHHLAALPEGIEKKNVFCVLRDPYSWYESFWLFRNHSKKWKWCNKRRRLDRMLSVNARIKFQIFISEMIVLYPRGFLTELYTMYANLSGTTARIKSAPKVIQRLTGKKIEKIPDPINVRQGSIEPDSMTIKRVMDWEREALKMVARCE